MPAHRREDSLVVRGIEISPGDTRRHYREKIARITLDSMVQFVALLDTNGAVLEINQAALDAVGTTLAEVEGQPFWSTRWWQVSDEVSATLRASIARAARGELVRWDTTIYGRAGGDETIVIDASLAPVVDDRGRVVFICAEGRDITAREAREREQGELHQRRSDVLDSDLDGARSALSIPRARLGTSVAAPALDSTTLEELRPAPPRAREAGSTTARTVLVVEDDRDMNRSVSKSLAKLLGPDHRIESAFDGREGLDQALTLQPMLVVLGSTLPRMSSVEVISEMRLRPELAETPVLLLSEKADEELMVKLLDEGAADFIAKPFSEKELGVRVRNLVLAQESREANRESLRRALAARRDAELEKQLLHSLFMQAPTLIAVLGGPDHVVVLVNPPMCEVWGVSEDRARGLPLREVLTDLRDHELWSWLDGVYTTGETHIGEETPVTLHRGEGVSETRYFDFAYSPYRNATGQVEGVFVIAADVTAQTHARAQMSELRNTAESANRAKDDFLAMLGHELRNPLSPILTALQLMKLRGEIGAERERTVIERQVRHLTRLVDDLLDVARIARGRVDLETEVVDIGDVVGRAIEMASPLLEERAHALAIDVPRGLELDGDVTRLSQVVSNLLSNAAKYTPPGGKISIAAARVGPAIVLTVHDTGIGIAPDVLPRIFDLFVQERQALDRSMGGLGIGLSIVRSLVERHGGTVEARSDGPGRGTEFTVRLPARAANAPLPANAGAAPALGPPSPSSSGVRVLVVDDNEDAADMLSLSLGQKGYDTRVAHDAPTALRVAAEFSPEVALLDIGLPVMDGFELAAHLRNLPGLANVRLIALTGYGQDSDRRRSEEAGFHHHLVKPVDLGAVEATVAALARRS